MKRIWIVLGAVVCCVALIIVGIISARKMQPLPIPDECRYGVVYHFNEEQGTKFFLDEEQTKLLEQKLSIGKGRQNKRWTLEKVKDPVIGIGLFAGERRVYLAYTNGYVVFDDGSAYQTDLNLVQWLENNELLTDGYEYISDEMWFMHAIVKAKFGWDVAYLYPLSEMDPAPKAIKMQMQSWTQEKITVTVTNESAATWMYGVSYHMEVKIGDTWYRIPFMPEAGGFGLAAYGLGGGESMEYAFDPMSQFGILPPGTYRLVWNGLTVEHTIK